MKDKITRKLMTKYGKPLLSPGADCIELRQKMEFPLPASLKELSKFTSLTEAIGAEFSLEQ